MTQLSSLASLYKTMFSPEEVLDLTYGDNNVLWALLGKTTNFYGDAHKVPIEYAPPAGRAGTFSNALTNDGDTGSAASFLLTRSKDYQIMSLDGESMDASENDEGAFVDLFVDRTKAAIKNLGRTLNFDLYRSGYGVRGQVATSGISTVTLTLADPKTTVFFEKGMVIRSSANADGTSMDTGTATIKAVNRKAGTLTATANWATGISAITDAHYLYVDGDQAVKVPGLNGYCPDADPIAGSDSFYGLDRSSDRERLAGVISGDLTGMSIEEAVLQLNDEIYTYGGGLVKVNLMHSLKFTEFSKSLSSKVIEETKYGNVGFTGFSIQHAGGKSVVYGDRDCQYTKVWGINPEYMSFHSLKAAPRPLDYKETTRSGSYVDPNADGIIMRLGYRGALKVRAPSNIGQATI